MSMNAFDILIVIAVGSMMGTGIGLYMSKMIIERNMDGCLSARNLEDGAEFRIAVRAESA